MNECALKCNHSDLKESHPSPFSICFYLKLHTLDKIYSRRHIWNIFLIFHRKQDFTTETICMQCQILFSGKSKKSIISLSSAELTKRVVMVKGWTPPFWRVLSVWDVSCLLLEWFAFEKGGKYFSLFSLWGTSIHLRYFFYYLKKKKKKKKKKWLGINF